MDRQAHRRLDVVTGGMCLEVLGQSVQRPILASGFVDEVKTPRGGILQLGANVKRKIHKPGLAQSDQWPKTARDVGFLRVTPVPQDRLLPFQKGTSVAAREKGLGGTDSLTRG